MIEIEIKIQYKYEIFQNLAQGWVHGLSFCTKHIEFLICFVIDRTDFWDLFTNSHPPSLISGYATAGAVWKFRKFSLKISENQINANQLD